MHQTHLRRQDHPAANLQTLSSEVQDQLETLARIRRLLAHVIPGIRLYLSRGRLETGSFLGDLANAGGTLCPGASPGVLTIEGDYAQEALGALEIELGGFRTISPRFFDGQTVMRST